MKIPTWMYKRQTLVAHPETTIRGVAKILDVEASLYREAGRKDAARAIKQVAKRLRELSRNGYSPAVAFDWPKPPSVPGGDSQP